MKLDELEKKVYILEKRINFLETKIKNLQNNEKKTIQSLDKKLKVENINILENADINNTDKNANLSLINKVKNNNEKISNDIYKNETEKNIKHTSKIKKISKYNESIVGKYIIGALASLLVFIGAVSFVAIVWNKISPEIKLSILSLSGILLTTIGLKMSLKKSSPISSIILGTGAGLVYIAILSANLAFNIIEHEASTIICTLWTACLMLSYKYTKLYFTVITAYIGSYINLISELNYVNNFMDFTLILVYTTSICIILIYSSYKSGKVKYTISMLLCILSYATTSLFDSFYLYKVNSIILSLIPAFSIFIIKNLLYRLANEEKIKGFYFIASFISTFTVILFLNTVSFNSNNLDGFIFSLILFIINLIQFVINNIFYKNIEKGLSTYYLICMYFSIMIFNADLFNIFSGASVVVFIILIKEKILKNGDSFILPTLMIILDTILIVWAIYASDKIMSFIYPLMNTILLFYLIFRAEKTGKYLIIKTMSLFVILFNCFIITEAFLNLSNLFENITDIGAGIGHVLAIIILFSIYKLDLFKLEDDKNNTKKRNLLLSDNMSIYISAILLYAFGIIMMNELIEVSVKFILTISTLVVCLMQTYLSIKDKEDMSDIAGIWIVIKYLLFTWSVLNAFWSLPIDSVIYSVSGLILAVFAIYFGFRLNIKITRHFGLAITMLMVAKFIFVDLQGENSITRVISFVAGGILCFIISIIYNRLSKN